MTVTLKYVPTTLTTSTTPTTQAVRTIDKVASRVISDAEICSNHPNHLNHPNHPGRHHW